MQITTQYDVNDKLVDLNTGKEGKVTGIKFEGSLTTYHGIKVSILYCIDGEWYRQETLTWIKPPF